MTTLRGMEFSFLTEVSIAVWFGFVPITVRFGFVPIAVWFGFDGGISSDFGRDINGGVGGRGSDRDRDLDLLIGQRY